MYIITHLKCWNKMCRCKIEISFNCINVHDNFFVESKNQIKTYFFFLKKMDEITGYRHSDTFKKIRLILFMYYIFVKS